MANNSNIRIGIDVLGTDCPSARVERQNDGLKVLNLSRHALTGFNQSWLLVGPQVVLSISDDDVIFKTVHLPLKDYSDKRNLIKFELRHLLLDVPQEYCYDIVQTDGSSRFLAVLARLNKLEKVSELAQKNISQLGQPEGYMARSIALGRGFLQYCANDTDRLVCLADCSIEVVSLCFVLGRSIIAPASFHKNQIDIESDFGLSKITGDLKTIINFNLNQLADRGINISLSKIIICGSRLNWNQKHSIASKLDVQLEEPVIDESQFVGDFRSTQEPLSNYLVSLGLTVE